MSETSEDREEKARSGEEKEALLAEEVESKTTDQIVSELTSKEDFRFALLSVSDGETKFDSMLESKVMESGRLGSHSSRLLAGRESIYEEGQVGRSEHEKSSETFEMQDKPQDSIDSYEDINFPSMQENVLLEPVQRALRTQLEERDTKLSLELKERGVQVMRLKKEREDIGVALYGLQQQLAQSQLKLEETQNKVNSLALQRAQAEDIAEENRVILEGESQHYLKNKENQEGLSYELNGLKMVRMQIQEFKQSLQGEVKIAKRTTHKTEDDVTSLEQQKNAQDLDILLLNDRLKALQSELQAVSEHRAGEELGFARVKQAVDSAVKQLKVVEKERKNVLDQWSAAVSSCQKRDEVMETIGTSTRETLNNILVAQTEIRNLKKQTTFLEAQKEGLITMKERIQADSSKVDASHSESDKKLNELVEQSKLSSNSLEIYSLDAHKLKVKDSLLQKEFKGLQLAVTNLDRQRLANELEANFILNDKITADKSKHHLYQKAKLIQARLYEKDVRRAEQENSLARLRIESLNVSEEQAKLEQLQEADRLGMKAVEKKVAQLEKQVKHKSTEMEKRLSLIDKLNRKYVVMTESSRSGEDESLGPLESTIKHLGREIDELKQENQFLERCWLNHQADLVAVSQTMIQKDIVLQEAVARETVLRQKKQKVEDRILSQEKSMREVDGSVAHLHKEIERLNQLTVESQEKKKTLASETSITEAAFVKELGELEEKSSHLNASIQEIEAVKEKLYHYVQELQVEVKAWEKKIKVTKDTQEALNPKVGQNEVKQMKSEIGRLTMTLEGMKRKQVVLVKDMERAILKRGNISMKHNKGALTFNLKQKPLHEMNKVELQKKMAQVSTQIQELKLKCQHCNEMIAEKVGLNDKYVEGLGELMKQHEQLAALNHSLSQEQDKLMFEQERIRESLERATALLEQMQLILQAGPDKRETKTDYAMALQAVQQKLERLCEVVSQVGIEHPELSERLNQLKLLACDL